MSQTVEDLFNKEAPDLTAEDVKNIYAALLTAREKFYTEEKVAKKEGRRVKPSTTLPPEKLASLSLDDLELGGKSDE